MNRIYVIHENEAWVEPLRAAFAELSLPFEEWFLDKGMLDFSSEPPRGVFYNRMSASSHTRDHRYAAEYTSCVLPWLELHGRRVVNGSRALRLEINKIAQYAELEKHGIRTPRTLAAVGKDAIVEAAQQMKGSFITKHNRAGKGLGVRLFHSAERSRIRAQPVFEDSVDGVTLVQEYIKAPEPFITRVEFVGGKFLYAVKVDTTLGFELCPPTSARSAMRCARWARSRPRRRRVSRCSRASTIPSSRSTNGCSRPTMPRSRAWNSSGTSAACCTRTTSTRTPTTTAPPRSAPANRACAPWQHF
jgi:hypothetical protein